MTAAIAAGLAGAFGLLAALHVWWAVRPAGSAPAHRPHDTVPTRADGTPLFVPGPGVTLAVAGALVAAAVVVLGRGGLLPATDTAWSGAVWRVGTWGLAGVLLLRVIGDFRWVGLFRRERRTRFARRDAWCYTPACAALAAGVLYLATR
jgi:hypothetical protein